MLTKVSVIFSFENSSPIARYFKESDIKPYGFSDILFARKLAKQITLFLEYLAFSEEFQKE